MIVQSPSIGRRMSRTAKKSGTPARHSKCRRVSLRCSMRPEYGMFQYGTADDAEGGSGDNASLTVFVSFGITGYGWATAFSAKMRPQSPGNRTRSRRWSPGALSTCARRQHRVRGLLTTPQASAGLPLLKVGFARSIRKSVRSGRSRAAWGIAASVLVASRNSTATFGDDLFALGNSGGSTRPARGVLPSASSSAQ